MSTGRGPRFDKAWFSSMPPGCKEWFQHHTSGMVSFHSKQLQYWQGIDKVFQEGGSAQRQGVKPAFTDQQGSNQMFKQQLQQTLQNQNTTSGMPQQSMMGSGMPQQRQPMSPQLPYEHRQMQQHPQQQQRMPPQQRHQNMRPGPQNNGSPHPSPQQQQAGTPSSDRKWGKKVPKGIKKMFSRTTKSKPAHQQQGQLPLQQSYSETDIPSQQNMELSSGGEDILNHANLDRPPITKRRRRPGRSLTSPQGSAHLSPATGQNHQEFNFPEEPITPRRNDTNMAPQAASSLAAAAAAVKRKKDLKARESARTDESQVSEVINHSNNESLVELSVHGMDDDYEEAYEDPDNEEEDEIPRIRATVSVKMGGGPLRVRKATKSKIVDDEYSEDDSDDMDASDMLHMDAAKKRGPRPPQGPPPLQGPSTPVPSSRPSPGPGPKRGADPQRPAMPIRKSGRGAPKSTEDEPTQVQSRPQPPSSGRAPPTADVQIDRKPRRPPAGPPPPSALRTPPPSGGRAPPPTDQHMDSKRRPPSGAPSAIRGARAPQSSDAHINHQFRPTSGVPGPSAIRGRAPPPSDARDNHRRDKSGGSGGGGRSQRTPMERRPPLGPPPAQRGRENTPNNAPPPPPMGSPPDSPPESPRDGYPKRGTRRSQQGVMIDQSQPTSMATPEMPPPAPPEAWKNRASDPISVDNSQMSSDDMSEADITDEDVPPSVRDPRSRLQGRSQIPFKDIAGKSAPFGKPKTIQQTRPVPHPRTENVRRQLASATSSSKPPPAGAFNMMGGGKMPPQRPPPPAANRPGPANPSPQKKNSDGFQMPRAPKPRKMNDADASASHNRIGACSTCGCTDFSLNAFKPGSCNNCFHKHDA